MSYDLKFLPLALKEWKKLDHSIKTQFRKKLAKILINPHISSSRLHGFENHYKVKLRSSGFRIVYEDIDNGLMVYVIVKEKKEWYIKN